MIGYAKQLVDFFNSKDKKEAKPLISDPSSWVDQTPKISRRAQSIPASLFWKSESLGIYRNSKAKSFSEFMKEGNLEDRLKHVPFDLFISENHKLSFRVGDHPLQNGVTISDHVKKELREVTIEGMFTNHPVNKSSKADVVTFKYDYAKGDEKQKMDNTALANFNKLKLVAEAKKPVRLVCALDTYPKMVITEISYNRDSKSGSSIRFTMTLREVITVDLQSTTQDIEFDPQKMINDNDKNIKALCENGKQSAEDITPEKLADLNDVDVGTSGN